MFAERFYAGIAFCRGKGKSCTAGKKIPASVCRVASALAAWRQPKQAQTSSTDLTGPGLQRQTAAGLDRAAILKMYGVHQQTEPKQAVQVEKEVQDRDLVHIVPSQEDEVQMVSASGSASSSSSASTLATKQPWVQYWVTVANAFARAIGGQVVATAKTSAGPLGYAQGVFPGETQDL